MKAMYVQKGQRMTKRMVSLTNIKKNVLLCRVLPDLSFRIREVLSLRQGPH